MQRAGTNALTGALANRRRRPCLFPPHRDPAIPQSDWPKPITPVGPGTILVADPAGGPFINANSESRLWRLANLVPPNDPLSHADAEGSTRDHDDEANKQSCGEAPRQPTAPHTPSAHLPMSDDEFFDVFGHGGALD